MSKDKKIPNSIEEIAEILIEKLKNKITNITIMSEMINGYYKSPYNKKDEGVIPFIIRYKKDNNLKIAIGYLHNDKNNGTSPENMAALSELYTVIREMFGEPTLFEDSSYLIQLRWFFKDKDKVKQQYIERYQKKSGLLIIFDNNINKESDNNKIVKQIMERKVGLPFGLIKLIDDEIEEYIKYKTGRIVMYHSGDLIDGYPITSYEEKLKKRERKRRRRKKEDEQ